MQFRGFLIELAFVFLSMLIYGKTEKIFDDFTDVFKYFLKIVSALSQLCQFAYFTRYLLNNVCFAEI
jgi:hypothetical protein